MLVWERILFNYNCRFAARAKEYRGDAHDNRRCNARVPRSFAIMAAPRRWNNSRRAFHQNPTKKLQELIILFLDIVRLWNSYEKERSRLSRGKTVLVRETCMPWQSRLSRHELSRAASVPPSGYAGTWRDIKEEEHLGGKKIEERRCTQRRGKEQWLAVVAAFIGPYRPTVGWVELVISHSAMR